jgi:predicted nucleic acid-binding protein
VSGYLIDANVFSETQKPVPSSAVVHWLREHEADIYTSAVVIGEIAWGIERLPTGKKRRALAQWLHEQVIPRMEGRILRFDTRVALVWGQLQTRLEANGKPMPWRDSVIAATALRHDLAVATRNERDYEHAGLDVVNPFAS